MNEFSRCLVLSVIGLLPIPGVSATQGHLSATQSFQEDQVQAVLADANARYALVTRPGTANHGVDLVQLDPVTRRPLTRLPTALSCDRLHASTEGQVLCFSRFPPAATTKRPAPASHVFSRGLKLVKSNLSNDGTISRARISSDGKYTATTAFVKGHSYLAGPGQFSTATLVGGGTSKRAEENIQQWHIVRKGARFGAPDINLWGVTFDPKDSNRFFVTVHTAGVAYLGQGDVSARRIDVSELNGECPSFSPDGTRLAFKKKVSALRWAPAVLDLATRKEQVFDALPDSVDDQIEWLDNSTLIYEVTQTPLLGKSQTDLVTLDLRSSAPPRQNVWLRDARSPTFVGKR